MTTDIAQMNNEKSDKPGHELPDKSLVTVYLDGAEKHIPHGSYTTEELITVLGVEDGYLLNLLDNGQLRPLQPGQKMAVKKGMQFISQVPCGGSS
jgi:hypothetical protein